MPANITVMEMVEGECLLSDGNGRGSMEGKALLEPRLVLKYGIESPRCSRYHIPRFSMRLSQSKINGAVILLDGDSNYTYKPVSWLHKL